MSKRLDHAHMVGRWMCWVGEKVDICVMGDKVDKWIDGWMRG